MSSTGKKKEKREKPTLGCPYCEMTFRKLEHLQRHERTHTLDRPYACDTCGKTFARQDTLHRHSRLHSRKDGEEPTTKAPKKRRVSNASPPAAPAKSSSEGSPGSSSTPASSSSAPANVSTALHLPVPPVSLSNEGASGSGLGLSMSLPVVPPSFPAYVQPEFTSTSINPSVIPLTRRFSDVSYGTALPARHDGVASIAGGEGNQAGSSQQRPALLGARPRALTLAGLPESLGCFSLVNSPAPSDNSDSSTLDDDGDEDSDALMKASSSSSVDDSSSAIVWTDPFPPPESHYPSPAFSSYSPSTLQCDPLTNLQAILDNDPVPALFHHQPTPPPTAQPEFDFEAFAASIEGPSPLPFPATAPPVSADASARLPATLEELLAGVVATSGSHAKGVERYPTPPSGTLAPTTFSSTVDSLPSLSPSDVSAAAASFDLTAELSAMVAAAEAKQNAADAEQQAREAAATAALFGGFGVGASSPLPIGETASSALGLDFSSPQPSFFPPVHKYQPPPPPQRGLSLPVSASAPTSTTSPASAANPCFASFSAASFSSSLTASHTPFPPFGSLSGPFTTSSYPNLSLPVDSSSSAISSFDLSSFPLSSSFSTHTHTSTTTTTSSSRPAVSLTDAAANNGMSTHDLLAQAWTKHLSKSPAVSAPTTLFPLTVPPPKANAFTKLPAVTGAPPTTKSMAAFYIPSAATEKKKSQTAATATKLSLPVAPTWLS
ncbi:hypothetical protein JCM8547_001869 [Rhodosporidiobolus lusitaniae]